MRGAASPQRGKREVVRSGGKGVRDEGMRAPQVAVWCGNARRPRATEEN